ncbi:MAG: hypothetical protein K0S19_722, partial [Geminicoccaceae bacterium]|nr:hypothetical protein [Geminicoccaceae bacterium]
YEFRSALAGDQFYLGEPDPLRARVSLVNLHGLDLSTDDIHTVLVSSRRAAWLVDEGPVQPVIKEIFSPRADLSLTRDGLYLPMDVAEACDEILMGLQQ